MAEAELSRDEIIRGNLEAFLPYICCCVKATDLLKLHYFNKEQRKKIFQLSMSDDTAATRLALNLILYENRDPGRFVALKDMLAESKYPKLVRMLEGEHVPCDANCRKIVDLFAQGIVENLFPSKLLARLVAQGTITSEDSEEIFAEETNHTRFRACWRLLFLLPSRVDNWFHSFLEALIDNDYGYISKSLDPDLHNKITLQRDSKKEEMRRTKEEEEEETREHVLMDYVEGFPTDDLLAANSQHDDGEELDSITEKNLISRKREKVYTSVSEFDNKRLDSDVKYSKVVFINNFDDEDEDEGEDETVIGDHGDVPYLANRESAKGHDEESGLNFDFMLEADKSSHQKEKMNIDTVSDELPRMTNNNPCNQSFNCISATISKEKEEVIYTRLPDVDVGSGDDKNESDNIAEAISILTGNGIRHKKDNDLVEREDNQQAERTLSKSSFRRTVDHDTLVKLLKARQGLSLQDEIQGQNDLNINGYGSSESEFNIKTDEDRIDGMEDEDISLREYQKELAKEGCDGENVIVIAPTNTGKTRVACRIIQVHLQRQRRNGKIGKVIFLVENEALAFQQGKECAERLPAYRTKVISGSVQRDKKQYLKDFITRRDILVLTAQLLVNALNEKEIRSLTQFSLIVFDECHHTDNFHRFNEVMRFYMDLKLTHKMDAEDLPQIVGLTASLGVGGSTREEQAMNHMKNLLANMDVKYICTVRKNIEELRFYENNPDEQMILAGLRTNDLYWDAIIRIVHAIDAHMRNHRSIINLPNGQFCKVPPSIGSEKFMQWLSAFRDEIGKLVSEEARRVMNPCRRHLEVYNKALMIHKDARTRDAQAILEKFMEDERTIVSEHETDRRLLELYTGLEQQDFSNEPPNPKLVRMQELVLNVLGNNEDARGIVFVKTRELARALIRWMNETAELRFLRAVEFVGQGAPSAQGGMTKSEQKDVLEYFKGGRHKIIFATSVAEEGLDITKCNLVIRYEHVTNEIVRLQSRGRARAANSRYYVLTQRGSEIVSREEKNVVKEHLMNRVVPQLQAYIENDPNAWEDELYKMQLEKKLAEELKKQKKQARIKVDEVELKCINCSTFICFASDIRVIQNAHHVIINEDVKNRLVLERNPVPKFFEDDIKFDGTTYCGARNCRHELGGVCEYKHAEFPLVRIKNFVVVDKNGKSATFKQWKKIDFYVEHFTLDDLREVVEKKRARLGN